MSLHLSILNTMICPTLSDLEADFTAPDASQRPLMPVEVAGMDIKPATKWDLPPIDLLQKRCARELGFLHKATLEGKLKNGEILVAREQGTQRFAGYVIASDHYHKRQEVGVVYQMGVMPKFRRRQLGALLLKTLFASWPRGVRLCGAWCARDLEANKFWEALGFVPLAYRAGSGPKGRVHIYWQRRTTAGDVTTPWWYPSVTGGGAMREDRIVLPIPPEAHWSQELPSMLPPAEEVLEEVPAGRGAYADGVTCDADGVLWQDGMRLLTSQMARLEHEAKYGPGALWFTPEGVKLVPVLPKPMPRKRTVRKVIEGAPEFARLVRDAYLGHVNETFALEGGPVRWDVSRRLPVYEDWREAVVRVLPACGEAKERRLLPAA